MMNPTINTTKNPKNIITHQHPQQNQLMILLTNCQQIIKQQQNYISKLQQDNTRKDSIIANLLTKNQYFKYKNMHHTNTNIQHSSVQQIQSMSTKLLALTQSNHGLSARILQLEKQIQIKNRNIKEQSRVVHALEEKVQEYLAVIQECRADGFKLKEMYQAKIAKILAEFRKKVEDDVRKSREKDKEREMQLYMDRESPNNIQELEIHPTSPSQSQNPITNIKTPTKNKTSNNNKSQRIQNLSTATQLQLNPSTQKHPSSSIQNRYPIKNFIYSKSKIFPSAATPNNNSNYHEAQKQRQVQMYPHKQHMKSSDVSYNSDYNDYEQKQDDDGQQVQVHGVRYDSNMGKNIGKRNLQKLQNQLEHQHLYQQKIPIKKIIKQFGEYFLKYQSNPNIIHSNNNNGTGTNSIPGQKITKILQELNKKLNKFQNEQIDPQFTSNSNSNSNSKDSSRFTPVSNKFCVV